MCLLWAQYILTCLRWRRSSVPSSIIDELSSSLFQRIAHFTSLASTSLKSWPRCVIFGILVLGGHGRVWAYNWNPWNAQTQQWRPCRLSPSPMTRANCSTRFSHFHTKDRNIMNRMRSHCIEVCGEKLLWRGLNLTKSLCGL